jgi:hypothetical protein
MSMSRLIAGLIILVSMSSSVHAQKEGGTLRVYHRDSPASMSIYEETTISTGMSRAVLKFARQASLVEQAKRP